MSQVAEGIENMASELNKVAGSLLSDWYNAVIHDLNLDPHTFQLMPGCLPLEKDDKIWEMFDSIPPLSDDHYYWYGDCVCNYDDFCGAKDDGDV